MAARHAPRRPAQGADGLRAAVQASALQQAEEIEAVLAEMAELRAENVRLAEGAIVKKAKGGGPKLAEALADPPEEEAHAEVD